jgi:hypothetical protein
VVIGFGSGGAELQTAVEGYEMTPQGLRKLGQATAKPIQGKHQASPYPPPSPLSAETRSPSSSAAL